MQYPPLNAGFSSPLLLERILQQAHKAEGDPKPQKLKIDQAVCEGVVTGTRALPWDCWLAFTELSWALSCGFILILPLSIPNCYLLLDLKVWKFIQNPPFYKGRWRESTARNKIKQFFCHYVMPPCFTPFLLFHKSFICKSDFPYEQGNRSLSLQ